MPLTMKCAKTNLLGAATATRKFVSAGATEIFFQVTAWLSLLPVAFNEGFGDSNTTAGTVPFRGKAVELYNGYGGFVIFGSDG